MKDRTEILGILLPDQLEQFLLPNVSIAEIFTLGPGEFTPSDDPQTFGTIGTIEWRHLHLPLYHLSPLLDSDATIDTLDLIERPRIAVINPVTKPGHACYAILATSTPRLTRLRSSDLTVEHTFAEDDTFAYRCMLGSETVIIPNLMHLERLAS